MLIGLGSFIDSAGCVYRDSILASFILDAPLQNLNLDGWGRSASLMYYIDFISLCSVLLRPYGFDKVFRVLCKCMEFMNVLKCQKNS